MNNKVMFSSEDMTWETPQYLFDRLNDEFKFELDVCANDDTAKCEKYFTPKDDGLSKAWDYKTCWMNPPYGREISKWLEKAYQSSLRNAVIVCLIPSRTDTKYWHDYVMKASEIRFIKGRLKFGNAINSAPFPSAIVVFNNKKYPDRKIPTISMINNDVFKTTNEMLYDKLSYSDKRDIDRQHNDNCSFCMNRVICGMYSICLDNDLDYYLKQLANIGEDGLPNLEYDHSMNKIVFSDPIEPCD